VKLSGVQMPFSGMLVCSCVGAIIRCASAIIRCAGEIIRCAGAIIRCAGVQLCRCHYRVCRWLWWRNLLLTVMLFCSPYVVALDSRLCALLSNYISRAEQHYSEKQIPSAQQPVHLMMGG
jgi:hypothetical protein